MTTTPLFAVLVAGIWFFAIRTYYQARCWHRDVERLDKLLARCNAALKEPDNVLFVASAIVLGSMLRQISWKVKESRYAEIRRLVMDMRERLKQISYAETASKKD